MPLREARANRLAANSKKWLFTKIPGAGSRSLSQSTGIDWSEGRDLAMRHKVAACPHHGAAGVGAVSARDVGR